MGITVELKLTIMLIIDARALGDSPPFIIDTLSCSSMYTKKLILKLDPYIQICFNFTFSNLYSTNSESKCVHTYIYVYVHDSMCCS